MQPEAREARTVFISGKKNFSLNQKLGAGSRIFTISVTSAKKVTKNLLFFLAKHLPRGFNNSAVAGQEKVFPGIFLPLFSHYGSTSWQESRNLTPIFSRSQLYNSETSTKKSIQKPTKNLPRMAAITINEPFPSARSFVPLAVPLGASANKNAGV